MNTDFLMQVDPSELGEWTQVLAWIVGAVLASVLLWRQFAPQPPLYKGEIDVVRKEAREGDDKLRGELEKKERELHGRISGLRDEIGTKLEHASLRMESAAAEIRAASAKTDASVNKLLGTVEQINQRQSATEQKVDRHIANERQL